MGPPGSAAIHLSVPSTHLSIRLALVPVSCSVLGPEATGVEKGHGDCSWLLSAHREAVFRKGSYPVDRPIGRLLGWGTRSEQQTGTPNLGAQSL